MNITEGIFKENLFVFNTMRLNQLSIYIKEYNKTILAFKLDELS